jgi:hypothetical protein
VWTGLALGTAVAIWAMTDGARLQLGGMPSWIGAALGAVVVWALIVLATTTLAELTRRHYKDAAKYALRQGRRGGSATARGARGARRRGQLAAGWAQHRWQARQPTTPATDLPHEEPAGPVPARRPDGKPETEADTRFFDLRDGGYTGPIDQDGYAVDSAPTGGTTDMTDTTTSTAPVQRLGTRTQRGRRAAAVNAGAAWKQLIADTADFEPEDDGHLLDWMAGEVTGMATYAESLTEVYETAVNTVGLDPVAMAALHDTADAAAEAASAMATARAKFASHYGEVREFAASGGLLPYNGRWMTGDGDA